MELTPGDDFVRSAKIRNPEGKMLEHFIKQLYPFELRITHSHHAVFPTMKIQF